MILAVCGEVVNIEQCSDCWVGGTWRTNRQIDEVEGKNPGLECLSIHWAKYRDALRDLAPIRQGVCSCFVAFGAKVASWLKKQARSCQWHVNTLVL